MTSLAWVVGSGGLLGSQVRRAAERAADLTVWHPPGTGSFAWGKPALLRAEIPAGGRAFFEAVAAGGHEGWVLFWCAGTGVVGSAPAELEAEAATWEQFLSALGAALDAETEVLPGRVFLASSAGAVYSDGEPPFTEESPALPRSAYGNAKLRQERVLADWACRRANVSTLVARISNLYGPGQKLDKPQGLISHMARCVIYGRPIHIYVPLDTIRDYVFAEDAARAIVRLIARLRDEAARSRQARHVLKICAAEEATTIYSLVAAFRRMARRRVRVVSGLHPFEARHPRCLQFRSAVWTDEPPTARTGLLEGISRVWQHQLEFYRRGGLPPPGSDEGA